MRVHPWTLPYLKDVGQRSKFKFSRITSQYISFKWWHGSTIKWDHNWIHIDFNRGKLLSQLCQSTTQVYIHVIVVTKCSRSWSLDSKIRFVPCIAYSKELDAEVTVIAGPSKFSTLIQKPINKISECWLSGPRHVPSLIDNKFSHESRFVASHCKEQIWCWKESY